TNVTVSGAPLIFCSGDDVVLTADPTPVAPPTGTYLYQWYKDGVIIPSATNATYTANTSGDYTVRVGHTTITDPTCYFESPATTVTVHTPISSNTISGGSTICPGGTATTLTGSTPSGGVGSPSYQWI